MKTKFSKLKRISLELDGEIVKLAEKNKIKYTDATRQVARIIQNKKNRRIIIQDEIRF